jgi:hypothetical protein
MDISGTYDPAHWVEPVESYPDPLGSGSGPEIFGSDRGLPVFRFWLSVIFMVIVENRMYLLMVVMDVMDHNRI